MNINYLFAAAGATTIEAMPALDAQQIAANLVAKQWDLSWERYMTGAIYGSINRSMLGLALLFFTITSAKILIEGIQSNEDFDFKKLFTPFLVILFLINNGAMALAGATAIRTVGNTITKEIVAQAKGTADISARFRGMTVSQEAMDRIKSQVSKCQSERGGSPAQIACMDEYARLINTEKTAGNIKDVALMDRLTDGVTKWATTRLEMINEGSNAGAAAGEGLSAPGSTVGRAAGTALGTLAAIQTTALDVVGAVALGPMTVIISTILLAITAAVQHMVEASLLLTGLITPIFLTTSLLPGGTKSVITLLTAFWSIINFKICYTIIVILTNSLITGEDANSLITLGFCTAIFSPVLAGILAGGSGMAFMKAASSAAGQVASFAGSVALSAASGGASTAAAATANILKNVTKKK
jgi:hypothetical protein